MPSITKVLCALALAAAAAAQDPTPTASMSPAEMSAYAATAKPTGLTESPYGYVPSTASCVAYLVAFSLLTAVHLGLGIWFKYYSAIVTMVVGGLLEILGWAGRLWSNQNPLTFDPFIMQICTLILGPTFFSAWDYTILGYCIKVLGPQYSLLGPNWYLIVFIVADIVSLVLQAIGGGGAAVQAQNFEDTTTNSNIMLSGILFQLATTTVFLAMAADFMWRVIVRKPYSESFRAKFRFLSCSFIRKKKAANPAPAVASTAPLDTDTEGSVSDTARLEADAEKNAAGQEPSRHWIRRSQILLAGVAWASVMIYIRGVYRAIELAQGWTGHLMTHEVYFIWLDGFMMALCMAGLAVAHPGWLLPPSGWC